MLQWLTRVLTPIFEGMGVSAVDVQTYVNMLSGYIYGILVVLLAVIVMMFVAQKARKGSRGLVRWTSVVAGLTIIAIIANMICFGPMHDNLAALMNGLGSVSEESASHSLEVIEKVGDEGIILAQNDGLLPLTDTDRINVFGWASTNPIYGGTGSGSSSNEGNIDILSSLKNAGFEINQNIIDMYTEYSPTRNLGGNVVSVSFTDWSLPEAPADRYTQDLMDGAKAFSDTAMIVLARSGGEGQDLPADMGAVIDGTYDNVRQEKANGNEGYSYYASTYTNNGDYNDYEAGESYLQLSKTERDMVDLVTSNFENVVLVVNANNPMELGFVNEYPQIRSVILAPGTGRTAMNALGKIVKGTVNPSGRTIETYVYDQKATPAFNNYGNFVYDNVADLQEQYTAADPGFQGVLSFVNYVEGIYVGYRFYETAFAEAEAGNMEFDYDSVVQYPFGHGLSYTTFTQEMEPITDNGDTISVNVLVTNTGAVEGKEVVELYFTPPYTSGGIEKSAVNLIDFAKTEMLAPGASETVRFEIAKEDLASYDSSAIKTENGGYVLEAGEYMISARADAHTVLAEQTFSVNEDIDYSETGRASDLETAVNRFESYANAGITYLSRANGFANYAEATAAPTDYAMPDDVREVLDAHSVANYNPADFDVPGDEMPTTGADNGLSLWDMVGASYDDERWDALLDQMTVEEMSRLVQVGGFSTVEVKSVGKVATADSDGTGGLNDWYAGVYGTPYPTETLIAQTWNKDLAAEVGDAIAQEYADAHIYGWYGPAMNMHRTAFNGRNFEYYSEDGVLAGYIASAEVNAAAAKGVYAYIKHFVVNDQEINRCTAQQIHLTEQTLREIYMKPFEICVKNFDFDNGPLAVMSSFTLIGPHYNGANSDLLNGVLRDEWGFQGMVLTDWYGSYGYQLTMDSVMNGNDMMLGFGTNPRTAIENPDSPTMVKALRQASKNIMFTIVRSGNYTIEERPTGMDNLTKTIVTVDVIAAAILIALEALVLVNWKRKKKAGVEVK
ncbi:MAG: glycoside hydrolase family 3 C-terminal domain-containing protein [Lachnospiraceae bacterium]|nr:glycoside hydrolase family 3 C-terminal domain-containing protein [Lachnospiraceae bacterium]